MSDNQEAASSRERRASDYISRVVERTLPQLPTNELRVSYARAMLMSVKLDFDNPSTPCPCSAAQIYKETLITIPRQKKYGISLANPEPIEFLQEFCFTEMSHSSFRKRNTAQKYRNIFQREPSFHKGRSLICTYAELLHLEDHLFEPTLPSEIVDLLDGWSAPSGNRNPAP